MYDKDKINTTSDEGTMKRSMKTIWITENVSTNKTRNNPKKELISYLIDINPN